MASPRAPEKAAAMVGEPAAASGVLAPACTAANWDARALPPLLAAGKEPQRAEPERGGASQLLFDADCSDSPNGPSQSSSATTTVDGVEVRLTRAAAAGTTGRGWSGNQCSFELRAADGSGAPVVLGPDLVPPFNPITALVRSGSAVWLSVGFNGYAREFPAGGNRVIAADLCSGRVVWSSANATSNGGLLLLGDYLISPYGFTSEPRFVYVLNSHTGSVVQKLPIVENVCPSESWRPHWHPGERCDAPGQRVGAATNPRISGNLLYIDTNTGSSTFAFREP
ncbi:MAG TPA: hypothetical protein VHB79_20165 [Polyangiaceae bacterium]|nr:hypothetical protein [Polyangiaceae bacterium]